MYNKKIQIIYATFDQKEDGTKVSQIFEITPDSSQFLVTWKNVHMDCIGPCWKQYEKISSRENLREK